MKTNLTTTGRSDFMNPNENLNEFLKEISAILKNYNIQLEGNILIKDSNTKRDIGFLEENLKGTQIYITNIEQTENIAFLAHKKSNQSPLPFNRRIFNRVCELYKKDPLPIEEHIQSIKAIAEFAQYCIIANKKDPTPHDLTNDQKWLSKDEN